MNQQAGRIMIAAGLLILIAGIIVYFAGNRLGFIGKLPGDIRVERENFHFYFPLTTCILISLIITLIVKVVQWLWK